MVVDNVIDFNKWSKKIHEQNVKVGWWDNVDRCLYETLQLVSTEVAEATEGERKDLMDDHLSHRKMGEVELADVAIRVLDIGGRLDLKYGFSKDYPFSYYASDSVASKHLTINKYIISFADGLENGLKYNDLEYIYGQLLNCVTDVCINLGYDLEKAMNEKHEYNKHRSDHKRKNREKTGGKKF